VKSRRDAVVKVIGNVGRLHGGAATIKPGTAGYDLTAADELIATCEYAKRLSDWAFERGAHSVRHDYDLKLSDWEP
jgi:hypothetical protein